MFYLTVFVFISIVKGINFFGDKSQFVVSGSDCGHIFLWDKETECIVNFLRGDENGVVSFNSRSDALFVV